MMPMPTTFTVTEISDPSVPGIAAGEKWIGMKTNDPSSTTEIKQYRIIGKVVCDTQKLPCTLYYNPSANQFYAISDVNPNISYRNLQKKTEYMITLVIGSSSSSPYVCKSCTTPVVQQPSAGCKTCGRSITPP